MSLEAWQEAAKRVKVAGPLPITFSVREGDGPDYPAAIVGTMQTLNVQDGSPTPLYTIEHLHASTVARAPAEPLFWVVARRLYEHELGEWYRVAGRDIRNEHNLQMTNKPTIDSELPSNWWDGTGLVEEPNGLVSTPRENSLDTGLKQG